MKKILIGAIASLSFCVLLAWAGPGPDMIEPLTISGVTTAATNSVTNATFVSGWVDAVVLDWTLGGTNVQTGTVVVATQGATGSGPTRTILALTAVTAADSVYYPRATGHGTTGSDLSTVVGEKIPLVQDKVYFLMQDCAHTNTTALTIRVILSPTP